MKKEQQFWNDLKSGKFVSMVKESSRGQEIHNPRDVFNVMKPVFAENGDVEMLYCMYLDTKNKIIAMEKESSGTLGITVVHPREIIKRVLALKAATVIVIHNHPSGDTEPSQEDRDITSRLWVALKSIEVSLLDHIIVGDSYYSFSDKGFFDSMDNECWNVLRQRILK